MRIDIVTLFPEMVKSVLSTSMTGRAMKQELVEVQFHQLRDFTKNKQKQTEGYPYGGGQGKVIYAQPVYDCLMSIIREAEENGREKPHVIFLTPAGETYAEAKAKELVKREHIVLVCGHYEGFDERVVEKMADEEISIGDYVLTGGEIAAMVVADSVIRLIPGVLKSAAAYEEESHYQRRLEYPQYTRPAVWEGMAVPEVLMSGDHEAVKKWQEEESLKRTMKRRPDLLEDK